jgi:hypothetical protein
VAENLLSSLGLVKFSAGLENFTSTVRSKRREKAYLRRGG